jgi:Flp pilus assembly protein TadG
MRRALDRFLAASEGASALELALVFPLFMILILAIFWLALLLWTENSIRFAADAAARCASVDGTSCGTVTAIQDAAIAWSNGVPIARANVTVNLGATCTAGVTGNAVTIRYAVTYFLLPTTSVVEACYPTVS